ncbi:hypothetical protein AB0J74_06010 [Asanoa sp. NPDC049573]|uniref:hypothetical protein n=1 Tax=Asanoa sp. NPDC049573 TaxID=3155396 RepID=UPI003428540B
MQKRNKRILAASLAVAGVLGAGGVAYAFSEFVNTGPVSGSAADMAPLTVGITSTEYKAGETSLWPGANHKASIVMTVNNSNEVPVKVTNTDVQNVSFTIGGPAGCTTALNVGAVSIDDGAGGSGNNVTVPAKSGGVDGTATIRIVEVVWLADSAPNDCQGKALTSKWKVTANSL